jgi:hypothetical protein
MEIGDFATFMLVIATVGSLVYVARQVSVTRRQTKGEFLLALDGQFEKFNEITVRLLNEEGFAPQGSEWPAVWGMMSVFERINIMVEDKIFDIGLVDRLHGFRLRGLIANDAIYQRLAATGAEWKDFIDLCYALADHRQKVGDLARDKPFIDRVRKLNKQTRKLGNPFNF